MIEAPTRIQAGNVEDLVSKMISAARAAGETLSLDMRQVESISRSAGAFLSNALLTALAAVDLDVIPPNRLPVEKIMSSSLGFAFAHRSGVVNVRNFDRTALGLDRWLLPYTPARQLLPFDHFELEEPSFLVRAQAAFVNPHETARRHHRTDVPLRIQSWLHTVLPPRALESSLFLQDLHDLTFELVDNVAEHADVVGAGAKSIVQVSVARGKEAEVRDRVWVLVMDTGPGILATALPKLLPVEQPISAADQLEFLRRLFQADAPAAGRARGLGLPRVATICQRWKGAKLEVVTETSRLTIDGTVASVETSTLRFQGTMVLARFTTPPVAVD